MDLIIYYTERERQSFVVDEPFIVHLQQQQVTLWSTILIQITHTW